MRSFKTIQNHKIVFFLLVILYSCNNGNTKTNNSTSIVDTKKQTCAVCKTLSRAVMIKATSQNVSADNSASTANMVLIKGGSFEMGSNDFPDSKPVHKVTVNSFYMDVHEVTNAQFAAFVKATGYKTVAEQQLDPKDYPNIPASALVPGSAVFSPPSNKVSLDNPMQWWKYVAGANWQHPQGPQSNIIGKEDYPVVQICYTDALAYAKWAGKRLPTEAEWEYAARAGKHFDKFYWGNDLKPNEKFVANIFQGDFPYNNLKEDGYANTAPVKSFPPNAFGLYDMEGNVWEWCNDFYRPDYYKQSPSTNPQGPEDSYDPDEPGAVKHVQRGGSFICSDQYCIRYRAGSRGKGETNSAGDNLGFRCVK